MESLSVALATDWLAIPMLSGFNVNDMDDGAGGAGVPMVSEALLLNDPTDAAMVATVFEDVAVNVTVATPEAFVIAVDDVSAPAEPALNETEEPGMTPDASLTVAATVVLPPLAIVEAPRAITIDVGVRGGVPMVIGAVPLIVPDPSVTEARIVAVELTAAPAVNWAVA